jgi:hypothetical protein
MAKLPGSDGYRRGWATGYPEPYGWEEDESRALWALLFPVACILAGLAWCLAKG